MRFLVGEKEFRIRFKYSVVGFNALDRAIILVERFGEFAIGAGQKSVLTELRHVPNKNRKRRRVVKCEICNGDFVAYSGTSRCNPVDVFRKEDGRKTALENALTMANNQFRSAAWKAYLWRKVKKVA